MHHFLIFGSHPRLSLAEFRAVRPKLPSPVLCGTAAIVSDPSWDAPVLMNLLGGTVKLGDIVGELPAREAEAANICNFVASRLSGTAIDFGWSVFGGGKEMHQRISRLAIPFKKELKNRGIPSRWVTGEHGKELSPAAVAKLKLTAEGLDICLFIHGETLSIGVSTEVQDADAWSLRDYGRPARDEKNGMLPPKLARMMVNLAQLPSGGALLDPFCGGGTVLMEAALATDAKKIIGSDLEVKQSSDTEKNITWLLRERVLRPEDEARLSYFTSDARRLETHLTPESIDRIVTEGYLGPPLRGHEKQDALTKTAAHISELWKESLKTFHPLLKKNGRIIGVWPGFKTDNGAARVDLTQDIETLGYTFVDPLGDWETSQGPLVYQRPEQKVSRRIVTLQKS